MAQKPKKGEPWKPKEKFDKKANKASKQKDQQEEQQDKEQQPKQDNQFAENEQPQKTIEDKKQAEDKKKVEEKQVQKKKEFLSHLPVFAQHSTTSLKTIIESQTLHPAFMELCISYQNGQCMGSTYRCVEFLNALRAYILDYKINKQKQQQKKSFGMIFNEELETIFQLLQHFRSINEGMSTSYAYIRHLMTLLMKYPNILSEQDQKEWLCQQINMFIESKIMSASELIVKSAQELISNGTSILIYARSYLIENFLIQSHKQGKQYQIFIVNNPPFNEGKQLLERLEREGIKCYYLTLSHVSYILNKVDKILVGASSMLCNGALISRVGTALLASLAKAHKIPLLVFCESYKFSEKSQIDSLSWNEIASYKNDTAYCTTMSLRYDLTQSNHIAMVISEVGMIPATSVKAVIKEFKKYNYVDKIEMPNKLQAQ